MTTRTKLIAFAKSELSKLDAAVGDIRSNRDAIVDDAITPYADMSYFFEGAESALAAAGIAPKDYAPVAAARVQVDAQLGLLRAQRAFNELTADGDEAGEAEA